MKIRPRNSKTYYVSFKQLNHNLIPLGWWTIKEMKEKNIIGDNRYMICESYPT